MAATYTISAYININIEGLLCERCRNGAQLLKISEGYDILLTFTKYFLNIFLVRLHSMEFRAYDLFFGHLFIRSAAWGIYRICVWVCSCVCVQPRMGRWALMPLTHITYHIYTYCYITRMHCWACWARRRFGSSVVRHTAIIPHRISFFHIITENVGGNGNGGVSLSLSSCQCRKK